MVDTTKLRALADWLDRKFPGDDDEVQRDLRKWSDEIDSLIARAAKAEAMARELEESFDHAAMDAKNAKDALASMTAIRDRLAAYVRANDARVAQEFSPVDLPASIEARKAARVAEKQARAAVDAAGDLEVRERPADPIPSDRDGDGFAPCEEGGAA